MRFVTLSALALLALAACRKEEELLVDLDQDGSLSDQDCDDTDATVFPGAEEICDGADNDCDGEVDEDANDAPSWYADADGDGHGDAAAAVTACAAPEGSVATDDDCDDTDAAFHPGAPETDCADPADYNCDGSVGFADADGDGFAACEECDDNESAVFPGGEEVCDGLDNDCDGLVDDEASDALAWYADVDGDGYGNAAVSERACEAPAGFVSAAEDCDDLAAAAHPGGTEVCDGLDNDCDGTADVAATDASAWYADADGDHYGDPEAEVRACAAPQGHVATAGDCDDAHAAAHPGGVEVCDSLDNDCDGEVDEDAADAPRWYQDLDDDGFGDAEVALESCAAPPGYVAGDQDCDDGDGDVFPGAEELCATAWDDDCDGQVNEADAGDVSSWHLDADGDGHGRPGGEVLACVAPDAHVASADDCDDLDADVAPGLPEVPGDGLDNDCVAGDDTPVVFVADRYDGDLWAVDRYSGVASLLTNSGEPATDLVAGADGLVYLARPDAIGLLAVDPSDGSHLEALTDEEFQWRGVTGLFEDRVADRLLLALSSGRVLSLDPATGDAELVAEALPALADVARLPGSDALWLVLRYAPGLYRLDPVDGVLEEVLSLPERTPRLALSSDGHLWLSGEGALYRVDTLHRRYEEQTVSVGLHGLCADATGEDLLLGTGGAGLQRYAVSTGITQPVAPRVGEAGACAVQVGTDYDGDGHQALRFGGDDCDDLDPGVYYGAADDSADGVDQNCDLVDGTDADRDGGASLATGGTDCDDADPAVFLGVAGCEAGARSCAQILDQSPMAPSGAYGLDPESDGGVLAVRCDMDTDGGGWTLVTPEMIASQSDHFVTPVVDTGLDGGLVYTGYANARGCGDPDNSQQVLLLIDSLPWGHIRYHQEFTGHNSCWSIFGADNYAHDIASANLVPFHPAVDVVRDEIKMGGTAGDRFDGDPARCDNESVNFWHSASGNSTAVRSASVILRRRDAAPAGLGTSMSCTADGVDAASPTWWRYSDVWVR